MGKIFANREREEWMMKPVVEDTNHPKTYVHNFRMVFCRNTDESKSRRGFGSLLRRHTSFGAPEGGSANSNGQHGGGRNGHGAAPLVTSPQDFHEY